MAVDGSILFYSSPAPLAFPTTLIPWVFLIPFTDVAFVSSLYISSVSALFSPSDDLWQRPVHKHEFPSDNLKSISSAQTPLLSFNSDSYFQSPPVNPQRCTQFQKGTGHFPDSQFSLLLGGESSVLVNGLNPCGCSAWGSWSQKPGSHSRCSACEIASVLLLTCSLSTPLSPPPPLPLLHSGPHHLLPQSLQRLP